ncbi:MAG: hypothetical protein M1833_003698 [Piccolia ochrophora]|nr:MAG: hypothetical protein M1833_003698 [Piccolia ochrophora]
MIALTLFGLAGLLTTAIASCIHDTQLHARDLVERAVPTFGYTGEKGPLGWARIDPVANKVCATGKAQSPINIDGSIPKLTTKATKPEPLWEDIERTKFKNIGTAVEVEAEGTLKYGGREWELNQFHFHTPSEHRIFEEHFPLEMHMVHSRKDDTSKKLVLGLTFELSDNGFTTTDLIQKLFNKVGAIATPHSEVTVGPVRFKEIKDAVANSDVYKYAGSLTTPPCSEVVTWLVVAKPLPLDVKSYNRVKDVVKFNSRYTQNTLGKENLLQYASRFFD